MFVREFIMFAYFFNGSAEVFAVVGAGVNVQCVSLGVGLGVGLVVASPPLSSLNS